MLQSGCGLAFLQQLRLHVTLSPKNLELLFLSESKRWEIGKFVTMHEQRAEKSLCSGPRSRPGRKLPLTSCELRRNSACAVHRCETQIHMSSLEV